MPLQVDNGMIFDGIHDSLTLPTLTYDTVVIDCFIDYYDWYGTGYSYVLGGGYSGLIRYQGGGSFFDTRSFTSYSGVVAGKRTTMTLATPSATNQFSVMSRYTNDGSTGGYHCRGIVYDLKVYNAGTLVAHYDFEPSNVISSARSIRDVSGNRNDATIFGSPQWTIKEERQGFVFDGTSSWIDIVNTSNYTISPTTGMTLESWVSAPTTNYSSIISKMHGLWAEGFWVYLYGGRVCFSLGNWAANSNYLIPLNTLIHIVFTFNGNSTVIMYINGVLQQSWIISGKNLFLTNSVDINIGSINDGQYLYEGKIYATRLYNTSLTASQVLSNYQGNVTRSSLFGEWGVDPTGKDTSGNGNDGVLKNVQLIKKAVKQGIQFIDVNTSFGKFTNSQFSSIFTNNQFTIDVTFSVKRVANTSMSHLVCANSAFSIGFNSSNEMWAYGWNSGGFSITTATSPTDGNVHRVIFTVKNGVTNGAYCYFDGAQIYNGTYTMGLNTTGSLFINSENGGALLRGSLCTIYDCKIYNRALSSTEVTSNFSNNSSNNGLIIDVCSDGTLNDKSGNGNNGIINNSSLFRSSIKKVNQGLVFKSNGNYTNSTQITIPYNLSLFPNVFTLETWFIPTDNSGGTRCLIYTKNLIINSCNAYFQIYDSAGAIHNIGSSGVVTGVLNHMIATYDGNIATVYINGVSQGTWTGTYASPPTSGYNFYIGNQSNMPFIGTIFAVRYFNAALSVSKVTQQYNAGISGSIRSNLIGEWCTDGTGRDTSGNGNNGTLVNNPIKVIKTPLR